MEVWRPLVDHGQRELRSVRPPGEFSRQVSIAKSPFRHPGRALFGAETSEGALCHFCAFNQLAWQLPRILSPHLGNGSESMPPLSSAPRPLCFVAMPFRKKAAPGTAPGPVWIPLVPCLTGKSWGRAGWRPYWTGAVKRWQVISLSIEAPAHFTRAAVGPISSVRSTWTNRATSTSCGSAAGGAACLASACCSSIMGIGLETRAAAGRNNHGSYDDGCRNR
jgi:hypothetical protein